MWCVMLYQKETLEFLPNAIVLNAEGVQYPTWLKCGKVKGPFQRHEYIIDQYNIV